VLLIGVPLAGVLLGVGSDLHSRWLRTLQVHHAQVLAWVELRPVLALFAFAGVYFVVVTCSLPGAVWMSLLAGYFFGPWVGALVVLIAATGGATAVFMLGRLGFAERKMADAKAGRQAFRQRLRDHAFWVLLGVRLIPIFPFWLINLAAAAVGMRLSIYVAATLLGIIPGAVLYTATGSGLGKILDAGEQPDLAMIWQADILLPLLGLAVLAVLPVVLPSLRRALQPEEKTESAVEEGDQDA
jgi:uncharacterized membrane protein YdjX (TVP38/TMEM64 family)